MKDNENIGSQQGNEEEKLPFLLENLRSQPNAYKVPEGYFDRLNNRIINRINEKRQKTRFLKTVQNKVVWIPLSLTTIAAVLLIFVIPASKQAVTPLSEIEQIELAYDPTYAEEALLNESERIENELATSESLGKNISQEILTQASAPTEDEIVEYLNEECTETELITQ